MRGAGPRTRLAVSTLAAEDAQACQGCKVHDSQYCLYGWGGASMIKRQPTCWYKVILMCAVPVAFPLESESKHSTGSSQRYQLHGRHLVCSFGTKT